MNTHPNTAFPQRSSGRILALVACVTLLVGCGIPSLSAPSRPSTDGTPVPSSREKITPANAGRVTQLARWGKDPLISASTVWSPDQRTIAVTSFYGVYLYDAGTTAPARFIEHPTRVIDIAFSPDGTLLASASEDNVMRLWRVRDGAFVRAMKEDSNEEFLRLIGVSELELVRAITGHTSFARGITFSSDGTLLASGSRDRTVRLWRVGDGTLLRVLRGHTDGVSSVAFNREGTLLASGAWGFDHSVRLWRVSDGSLVRLWSGQTDTVSSIAFSPDDTLLAVGDRGKIVRLWRVSDGSVAREISGPQAEVLSVAFSPDGMQLAAASSDQVVWQWRVDDASLVSASKEQKGVRRVGWDAAGTLFAWGSDANILWWRQMSGETITREVTGHSPGMVWAVAPSPDGTRVAWSSTDNVVRLRRASDGAPIGEVASGATDSSIVFSPDGTRFITTSPFGSPRLWQASDLTLVSDMRDSRNEIGGLAFSPDSTTIASAGSDNTVRLWRARDGSPLRVLTGHTALVTSVAFSRDGTLIASTSRDRAVRLWRVSDGMPIREMRGQSAVVYSVAFSPNGTLIASGGDESAVRLWRVNDGGLVRELKGHMEGASVTFSPDGTALLVWDGLTLGMWRVSDGTLLREFKGRGWFAFTPNGALLATSGYEKILLWRTSDASSLGELIGHRREVHSLAFSADGTLLWSGGEDGVIGVWGIR